MYQSGANSTWRQNGRSKERGRRPTRQEFKKGSSNTHRPVEAEMSKQPVVETKASRVRYVKRITVKSRPTEHLVRQKNGGRKLCANPHPGHMPE